MKLKKIFIYVGVLTTFLFVFGCEKPATPVETPVEVVEETVVEDPAPVVEEPEVIESVEEPETTEEEPIEEVAVPNFILYDENGDYYQPQAVTLDEFYAKIAEAEEEYNFKTDWERDRFVGFLLEYNSPSLKQEDIKTIYNDYLKNFGYNVLEQQLDIESGDIFENTNKIPFSAYFIDARLVEEADIFENYLDKKGQDALVELLNEKIEEFDKNDKDGYNVLLYSELRVINSDKISSKVQDVYYKYGHDVDYADNNYKYQCLIAINDYDDLNYNKSEYISSHESNVKKK